MKASLMSLASRLFIPSPILQMGLEALCFRVVRPFVRAYVRAQAGAFCDRLAVDFQYFHWYRLFCSRITPTAFVSMQPALSANVHNGYNQSCVIAEFVSFRLNVKLNVKLKCVTAH